MYQPVHDPIGQRYNWWHAAGLELSLVSRFKKNNPGFIIMDDKGNSSYVKYFEYENGNYVGCDKRHG